MDDKHLKGLLEVFKSLVGKSYYLDEFILRDDSFEMALAEFLEEDIVIIGHIIGDYMNIPQESSNDNSFNRDFLFNLLEDYAIGQITEEETINMLKGYQTLYS